MDLQEVVEDSAHLRSKYNIMGIPLAVPREEDQLADFLCKLTDMDNIGKFNNILFNGFQQCGVLSPSTNLLLGVTPNAVHSIPVSGIWVREYRCVFPKLARGKPLSGPPPNQIIRAWKHFKTCKARGALTIPLWKEAMFWPCFCLNGTHLAKCVRDWVGLLEFNSAATVRGRTYNSMFCGKLLSLAVYVNWQNFLESRTDRGFSMTAKGLCDKCLKS